MMQHLQAQDKVLKWVAKQTTLLRLNSYVNATEDDSTEDMNLC